MKNILSKVLFYYSAIASMLITISLVLTSNTLAPVIFAVLFLPVTAYFIVEFFGHARSAIHPSKKEVSETSSKPQKGQIVLMILIFLILVGVSIRNIYMNKNSLNQETSSNTAPSASPFVFKTESPSTPSATLTIVIDDNSPSVNIRQKPTIYSEKVGEAENGETYTFTENANGWYKIELASGSGYISAKYVKEDTQ